MVQQQNRPYMHNAKIRSLSVKNLKLSEKLTFESEVQKLRKDYSNRNRYRQMKHTEISKSHKSKSLNKLEKIDEKSSKGQVKIGRFLEPTKIISLTAPKWAMFDFYSSTYIRGYRSHDPHDLGTFSKLLVFCAVNTLVIKQKLDMDRFQVIVTKSSLKYLEAETIVQEDDILSLNDILHLMLMAEGFEYELVLGLNIGAYLQKKQSKQYYSVYDANDKCFKDHLSLFYELVNSYCKFLKLQSINYLEHDPAVRREKNTCSGYDVALLSIECLKVPLFMDILKKKSYDLTISFINPQGHLQKKSIQLKNRSVDNPFISYFNVNRNWGQNQFMSSNCSVYYEQQHNQARPIVVVLLGSYSPVDRQKDIQQVVEWYLKNKNINPAIKKDNQLIGNNFLKTHQGKDKRIKTQIIQKALQTKANVNFNPKLDFHIRTHGKKASGAKLKTDITE